MRFKQRRFPIFAPEDLGQDVRRRPRFALPQMVNVAFVMVLCRLGSINALEQTRRYGFWRRIVGLGCAVPSADTMSRLASTYEAEPLRQQLRKIYRSRKRAKGLRSPFHQSLFALVVDGHECCSSYRRTCKDCLERRVTHGDGERIQYYHRLVSAVLVTERFTLHLDMEMQRRGEDEVTCAMRLFERLMKNYPKAFDIVAADGLYAQKPFIDCARKHHKHCLVVLKDERRDLLQESRLSFEGMKPTCLIREGRVCQVWDERIRASWADTNITIRVVRSIETSTVRRQRTKELESTTAEWIWATTIGPELLCTEQLLVAAHHRWDIENKCFNELCNNWHVDHVYQHSVNAIEFFWLMTMIACNIFNAFYWFDLKAIRREAQNPSSIARAIAADVHSVTAAVDT